MESLHGIIPADWDREPHAGQSADFSPFHGASGMIKRTKVRAPETNWFKERRLFLFDLLTGHEPTEFPHRFKATTDSFSFPIGGHFESEGRFKGRYGAPARRSPHFLARHSHHSLI